MTSGTTRSNEDLDFHSCCSETEAETDTDLQMENIHEDLSAALSVSEDRSCESDDDVACFIATTSDGHDDGGQSNHSSLERSASPPRMMGDSDEDCDSYMDEDGSSHDLSMDEKDLPRHQHYNRMLSRVYQAFHKVDNGGDSKDDSHSISGTQTRRSLLHCLKMLMPLILESPKPVFCDAGSGFGNIVAAVSAVGGVPAIGVEVSGTLNLKSLELLVSLESLNLPCTIVHADLFRINKLESVTFLFMFSVGYVQKRGRNPR